MISDFLYNFINFCTNLSNLIYLYLPALYYAFLLMILVQNIMLINNHIYNMGLKFDGNEVTDLLKFFKILISHLVKEMHAGTPQFAHNIKKRLKSQ